MHKKDLKFAPVVELAKLKFTYVYHSSKIAKAWPGSDDRPQHPSVQINSSSPWIIHINKTKIAKYINKKDIHSKKLNVTELQKLAIYRFL